MSIRHVLLRGGVATALAATTTLAMTAGTAQAMPIDACRSVHHRTAMNKGMADFYLNLATTLQNIGADAQSAIDSYHSYQDQWNEDLIVGSESGCL